MGTYAGLCSDTTKSSGGTEPSLTPLAGSEGQDEMFIYMLMR